MSDSPNAPELSIIVPVYNVEPWITQCLDSIQRQTFESWECVLVDDGSPDLSGRICDSFARRDNRFRVIHQKNAGVSAARNTGIDAAFAPLLTFIDPDDFISEKYFELLIQEMRRINADIAVSSFFEVESNGNEGGYQLINRIERYRRSHSSTKEMIGNAAVVSGVANNTFSCVSWGKVYRCELWGDARFPTGVDLGEDMLTVPGIIIKAKNAVSVPGATYFYRVREKSLLHGTVTPTRLQQDLQASAQMLRQLEEHAPDRKEDFLRLKLQYDIGCAFNFLQSNPSIRRGKSMLYALLQAVVEEDGDSNE